jgi:hypothetical protein
VSRLSTMLKISTVPSKSASEMSSVAGGSAVGSAEARAHAGAG